MILALFLIVAIVFLAASCTYVILHADPYWIRMRSQSRVQRHAVRRSRELADLRFEMRRDATRLLRDFERDADTMDEQ